VKLRLQNVPELANLPWEFLLDPDPDRFLALSYETPIVRYVEMSEEAQPLAVQGPLRLLLMASCPTGYDRLDIEREIKNPEAGLAP
jgi:hypothetical protein